MSIHSIPTAATPAASTNVLAEKAVLARPTISSWTARRFDRKASDAIVQANNATANAGRFNKALLEPQALDEGATDLVTVAYCDTRVTHSQAFERGDVLKMDAKGGGGTRFAPAFKWVAEHAPDASAVVYFTDLDCSDYGAVPDAPVIWAAWGDPRKLARLEARVPFGEVLRITE